MLIIGLGKLESRTRYFPALIRNPPKHFTCLILHQLIGHLTVSLHPVSPHSRYLSKRATVKHPQWKRSILDQLDGSGRSTESITLPREPVLSSLSEKDVVTVSSDDFSPLPVPPDMKFESDTEVDPGVLLEEPHIVDALDTQDIPDIELEESEKEEDNLDQRARLLRKIRGSTSFEDSWEAYACLLDLQKSYGDDLPITPFIPHHYLHYLAGRLAKIPAAGRRHFFRLLSVLTSLRTSGGSIFAWEWNSLIHCSAKSYRKTTVEDYRIAIGILKDMAHSASVCEQKLQENAGLSSDDDLPEELNQTIARPNIVTYTTLLAIASRTGNSAAVQHALSLLKESGLPWTARTHSAMIPHFMHVNDLNAFPSILTTFLPDKLTIRLITQIMWAYAYKGRMRIAMQLYDFLRSNIPYNDRMHFEETPQGSFGLDSKATFSSDDAIGNPILSIPGFIDHATMPPNDVTYCMMIQALCYHGDLIGAFIIFRDMLSTIQTGDRPEHIREYYKPRPHVYRAFFLGFARHAGGVRSPLSQSLRTKDYEMDKIPLPEFAARLTATPRGLTTITPPEKIRVESPWSLENLEIIFESFIGMNWETGNAEQEEPSDYRLSDRMIYWIMVSFAKVTNNDWYKLYTVWTRMDKQFDFSRHRLSRRLREMRDYLVERFGHLKCDSVDEEERKKV